jgi:hypothetical protein
MVSLLITDGVQQGRAYRLHAGVNRIGRSVENHFQIVDPSVSGSHCEITFSEDSILVRDLRSTNGTWINGEPIDEGALRAGQVLQVGNINLRLEDRLELGGGPAVVIPELEHHASAVPVLADGSPACANHPESLGHYRCSKCQQTLCPACVRVIRRMAGDTLFFCTLCSGPCEDLAAFPSDLSSGHQKKKGFFGRLTQTLKLPFKPRSN